MPAMDKKQKKEKKRAEKRKRARINKADALDQSYSDNEKSFGRFQIGLMVVFVILGAAFIVYHS